MRAETKLQVHCTKKILLKTEVILSTKGWAQKGKVEVKEKGKKPDQQSKDNNLHNLDDRFHSDDKSIQNQQD